VWVTDVLPDAELEAGTMIDVQADDTVTSASTMITAAVREIVLFLIIFFLLQLIWIQMKDPAT